LTRGDRGGENRSVNDRAKLWIWRRGSSSPDPSRDWASTSHARSPGPMVRGSCRPRRWD